MKAIVEILERYLLKNYMIENNDYYADSRLEIRINQQEKILLKKYAELRGVSLSKLIRDTMIKEIDSFIKTN